MRIHDDSTFSNATEVHGPGDYFVSAVDGPDFFLMAGPYSEHAGAVADVDKVKGIANDVDASGKAAFMAWGTCRRDLNSGSVGVLNKHNLL